MSVNRLDEIIATTRTCKECGGESVYYFAKSQIKKITYRICHVCAARKLEYQIAARKQKKITMWSPSGHRVYYRAQQPDNFLNYLEQNERVLQ